MHILGIHIDPPFTYTAHIYKGRRGVEIRGLKSNDLNVKPLYISNFKGRIVSAISAKECLIRPMELKIASQKHMEEALIFQSEAISHFNPAEVLTVPFVQKKGKESVEALLFTVPKEALRLHLAELEKLGADPDGVSTAPMALCHFMRWKFPDLSDAFIVDLGSHETTCVLMEKGQLKKAHAISVGVEKLLASLLEDRKKILLKKDIEGTAKQIDLLLLKPGLNPHLAEHLGELQQELLKAFHSFHRGMEKKPVIFTGRTDAFIHLREFLMDAPIQDFEEQKFAISLGLALEQTSTQPLQLRQQEFFPKKNWEKMGLFAVGLLGASLLLSATIYLFSSLECQKRKTEMVHLLPESQSKKAVEEQIDEWIAAVEKNNKEYPYILQAPGASEVLAWLSAHPLLNELKTEGDPIDLKEVRYQLVKFPKMNATKEPYLAKVELEFQFKSAMNGRRFHEALRNGDDLVNPQLEMTWDALNEGYRTSFFLKNRGPHVF